MRNVFFIPAAITRRMHARGYIPQVVHNYTQDAYWFLVDYGPGPLKRYERIDILYITVQLQNGKEEWFRLYA